MTRSLANRFPKKNPKCCGSVVEYSQPVGSCLYMTTQQQPILQPEQPGHGTSIQAVSGLFAVVVVVVEVEEARKFKVVAAIFDLIYFGESGISGPSAARS